MGYGLADIFSPSYDLPRADGQAYTSYNIDEALLRLEDLMQSRGVLVIFLLMFIAGCGGSSHSVGSVASTSSANPVIVDAVHVIRTSDGPSQLPAFDHIGNDASAVQALYAGLTALPAYVANGKACPPDGNVQYQITFTHNQTSIVNAIADPTGCQIVILSSKDNRTATNSSLWSLLATAVGVPLSAVYPV